jgi:hypothetical protein
VTRANRIRTSASFPASFETTSGTIRASATPSLSRKCQTQPCERTGR